MTLLLALATTIGVAGCGPSAGAVPSPIPTGTGGQVPSQTPTLLPTAAASAVAATLAPTPGVTPLATPGPATIALNARPWAIASLTEVSSGQAFTVAGLAGRTIFVEAMAIWCSKCREQQFRFKEALGRVDAAQVAYVVLTVDPAETAAELARYKRERGFVGMYAVAGREVSAALAAEFGANVLNPPTVPLIRITPSGEVSFKTGGESVIEIIRLAGG